MSDVEYKIEIGVDGSDQVVAVRPPVDIAFREEMFDVLDERGLIKEAVVREGFFETKHLNDGSPYSELRLSSTALSVTGQRIISLAYRSAEVLEGQNKTVEVSPYLVSLGGSRQLFGRE